MANNMTNYYEYFPIVENGLPERLSDKEMRDSFLEGNKDKLVQHNVRLVISIVQRIVPKFEYANYSQEDLVQIGCLGLVKAIDTFDIEKGFSFSSYAATCIKNEILMFLRKHKNDIDTKSFDEVVYYSKAGDEFKLKDLLSDGFNLEEETEKKEIYKKIRELIREMPERDKKTIMLRFGFYNNRIYSQREIADIVGISQPCVLRKIRSITEKIGIILNNRGLINIKINDNGNEKTKPRTFKTIYDYFSEYSEEEVNRALQILPDKLKRLLVARDVKNPIWNKLNSQEAERFYQILIPSIRKILLSINQEESTLPPEGDTNNLTSDTNITCEEGQKKKTKSIGKKGKRN